MSKLIKPNPPKFVKYININQNPLDENTVSVTRACIICGTSTSNINNWVCEDCRSAIQWVKKIQKQYNEVMSNDM